MNENRPMPEFLAEGNELRRHAVQIVSRLERLLLDLRGSVTPQAVDGGAPVAAPPATPPTSLADYLRETLAMLSTAGEQLDEIEGLV